MQETKETIPPSTETQPVIPRQDSDVVYEKQVLNPNGEQVVHRRRATFNGKTWIVFSLCIFCITLIILGNIAAVVTLNVMGINMPTEDRGLLGGLSATLGTLICYLSASLITGTFAPWKK